MMKPNGMVSTNISLPIMPQIRQFFWDFAHYAGRQGLSTVLLVTLGALVESIGLVLLIPLLGVIIAPNVAQGTLGRMATFLFRAAGVDSTLGRLGLLLTIFAGLMIVRAVIIFRRDVALTTLQVGFLERQRTDIIALMAAAPWQTISRLRHARVTHVMSGDMQRVGSATYFFLQSGTALIMLVGQAVLALLLSPVLTLFTVVMLALSAVIFLPLLRRSRDLGVYLTGANLTLLDTTTQFLGGLKLALSQNLQRSFVAEFHEVLGALSRKQIDFTRQQSAGRILRATLSGFAGALAVFIGFGLMGTAPAILITLLVILARMNGPAMQIQQGLQQVTQSLPAYEAVQSLKADLIGAVPSDIADGTPVACIGTGLIAFRDVHYSHDSKEEESGGVHGLELVIPQGAFVGIAGASGAGKTTFADLLTGLLHPQRGDIIVADRPLSGEVLTSWRNALSYVSQDPFLFHDTVRRNIAWANPSASEQDIWAALAIAGADGVVRRMERGLDTVVGERGSFVSGGERQRIALARALVRKPALLILDEATNAIDVAGEREIIARLLALSSRPTIIMIAHRTESLAHCRPVYHFENGRAVPRA